MFHPGTDTDGGFYAFAGRLPIADIVEQLVHMGIKSLLPFDRAPYLNPVFYEPFYNKRRFIVAASEPVKHEYKQNVKLALYRIFLKLLDRVTLFRGFLESRHAFFIQFFRDLPVRVSRYKLLAILPLHRNIVFFYLPHRRNTVEAFNTFITHVTHLRRIYFLCSLFSFQGTFSIIIIAFFENIVKFCRTFWCGFLLLKQRPDRSQRFRIILLRVVDLDLAAFNNQFFLSRFAVPRSLDCYLCSMQNKNVSHGETH